MQLCIEVVPVNGTYKIPSPKPRPWGPVLALLDAMGYETETWRTLDPREDYRPWEKVIVATPSVPEYRPRVFFIRSTR